jgi:hypothetical protein
MPDSSTFEVLISRIKQRRAQELRQKVLQGDLPGAQLALGGELTLEELQRSIRWQQEADEHRRADQELKTSIRRSRQQKRFQARSDSVPDRRYETEAAV